MKKLNIMILSVLLAVLLLAACGTPVDNDGGTTEPSQSLNLVDTKPTAEPATVPTTEPAPTETVKVCEHEWVEHPYRLHTARCTEDGEEFFRCKNCGEEKAEKKAAIGHYWVRERYISGDCATGITYHERCSNCGWERNWTTKAGEHNIDWANPGRVQEPTCTADGFRYAYCTVCGERAMETLPAAHKPGTDGKCTVCGEDCPIPTEPTETTAPTA